MKEKAAIGLVIPKNLFQVQWKDARETIVVRCKLRRGELVRFFEDHSPCLVGT